MFLRKAADPQPVPRTRIRSLVFEGGCSGMERSSNRARVFSARKRGYGHSFVAFWLRSRNPPMYGKRLEPSQSILCGGREDERESGLLFFCACNERTNDLTTVENSR
jgi:hypothetical protein